MSNRCDARRSNYEFVSKERDGFPDDSLRIQLVGKDLRVANRERIDKGASIARK